MLGERPNQVERLREEVERCGGAIFSTCASPAARSPRKACAATSASASATSSPGFADGAPSPIYNLMEDAATAEISRSQIWQWLRQGRIEREHVVAFEDARARRGRRGPLGRRARCCSTGSRSAEELEEFLTLPAYELSGGLERGHRGMDRGVANGIERPYTERRTSCACADRSRVEHTLARLGAERLWQLLNEEPLRRRARRDDRRPGGADGQGRPAGDLPVRLAGRGRREPRRTDLPRPEPLSGEQRACAGPAAQQRAPARRPDRARRGQRRPAATGLRRSWPTRRPASAARSTPSSS